MVNPVVSVVIPFYNVEQYLMQCVESILTQTYQSLEIILVDDGSTDGSGRLCDVLAQRDNRIWVIHKPNGGLSEARNAGTEACNGGVCFLSGQYDYLEQDAIIALVRMQAAQRGLQR